VARRTPPTPKLRARGFFRATTKLFACPSAPKSVRFLGEDVK
jgi:hypothetical protein